MKLLETLLVIIAVGLFAYIYFKRFISGATREKKGVAGEKVVEDINPANFIGKVKFKLMPYKEALEASRQFIYTIAKTVMQKFSPQAKESLLTLGSRLFNAGVQYIHVVDVFKMSLDKQRSKVAGVTQKKDQVRGQQK